MSLKEDLMSSTEFYANEPDGYRPITYNYSVSGSGSIYSSPAIQELDRMFESIGCQIDAWDTYPYAFSLNKDFHSAVNVESFRDYGYCVPKAFSIDEATRFVEIVESGDVIVIIEDPHMTGK